MASTRFLRRIADPPRTGDQGLDRWLRELAVEINQLPNFSTASLADGPESVVSAPVGTIFIDGNESANTIIWVKESGTSSTGWAEFNTT